MSHTLQSFPNSGSKLKHCSSIWYASNYSHTSSNTPHLSQLPAKKRPKQRRTNCSHGSHRLYTHYFGVIQDAIKRELNTLYRIQSALNHLFQPCLMTHTFYNASWNAKNQDIREAVEQSVQTEQSCAWCKGKRGLRPYGHLNHHPAHPHTSRMGVLTYTTLPNMLKPVVPRDEKGRKRRGGVDMLEQG
ncbi:hypothetical protein XENORESO_001160 [Xenotaenia resolanae]|uniref:Uncharacterized protein n=1 Tax=Xenotaenia resolanae TaxID=208358 RepID=A0ABV0WSF1_9TELE